MARSERPDMSGEELLADVLGDSDAKRMILTNANFIYAGGVERPVSGQARLCSSQANRAGHLDLCNGRQYGKLFASKYAALEISLSVQSICNRL